MKLNLEPQWIEKFTSITIGSAFITTLALLTACGSGPQLEACKFVEIEDAEFEVDVGDIDIEGAEVEMVCGDKIIDVAWKEFRNKLRVDPGQYKANLEAFKRQVRCMKDERSNRKTVLCNGPSNDDFVSLNFTDDD